MLQCTVSMIGSKSFLCCLPGYLPYPSVFLVLIHIFSWLFLWEPLLRFLWVILVNYLIVKLPPVSWLGALYLPLSCCLPTRTTIWTLENFGSIPYSSHPWSRALHQPLTRFPWRCLILLALFYFLWHLCVCPPYWPSLSWSWFDCWCFLRAWACGTLVSPRPFSWMLHLGVS